TTEPQKVIEAIRSRCQQHDFRRVRAARLVEHLAQVCAAEGVEAEPAALEMVARAADGSVRDAQSRLDQVLTFAGGRVRLDDVAPETRERLAAQAARFGPGELARVVRILGDLYVDLRTATDQRLVLEVGLARAALPEASLDADALLARIERLERRLAIGTGE